MAKDILKSTAVYTFLGFLPLTFALIFTPIYLKYLDTAEYGLFNLFLLYSGIITQLYGLGIFNAFVFLYWDNYKNPKDLRELISSTIGLLLTIQIIFIGLALVFGNQILALINPPKEFSFYPFFVWTLVFAAIMTYYEMFQYYFRNEGKIKEYSILSLSTLLLFTIGTVSGVIFLDLKSIGAIYGRTIGYGLVVIGFLIYFISNYGISIHLKKSKTILLFGFPLFVNAIIGVIAYSSDRLLVEQLDGIEALGVYGFSFIVISVLEIWFNAINNALSPTLYKYILENYEEKKNEIQGLSHLIVLAIMLSVTLLIAILHFAMDWFIPASFQNAVFYIPILATAFIWRVFTSLEMYSLYVNKKTKYIPISQLSNLIFTVVLGYALYQIWGIMGIVYAVYLVKVIEYIVVKLIVKKVQALELKLSKMIILAILLSVASFVSTIYHDEFNPYLFYFLPLLILILISPLLLKKDLINLKYILKNRKELFN